MNARTKRIDLGLAVAAVTRQGESLSCETIAAYCDCHPRAIEVVEQNALRKLKVRLHAVGLNEQVLHG